MNYWWQQLKKHPTRLLVGGFAAAILAGGLLLTLRVSASGPRIGFLDALFTATSAVCVTGLTVRQPTPQETRTRGSARKRIHAACANLDRLQGKGRLCAFAVKPARPKMSREAKP